MSFSPENKFTTFLLCMVIILISAALALVYASTPNNNDFSSSTLLTPTHETTMLRLFKANELTQFKIAVKRYCEMMGFEDLNLTEEELLQLSWSMGCQFVTPEARGKDLADKLHFEVKRSLTRRYSFELVLKGDYQAYLAFIREQNSKCILSEKSFNALVSDAKLLDSDLIETLKVSCLLVISDTAKSVLKDAGYTLSNDSEEFLSQLIPILKQNKSLFPIITHLNSTHLDQLQKMYWFDMHFRHMLYTEGGVNMTKSFCDGIRANLFTKKDFLAWKWRWLINMFGFQAGQGAKYFDSETHQLFNLVSAELEKCFANPDYNYLDNYLLKRAAMVGLDDNYPLSSAEQQLLGHIAAYFNQINLLKPQQGESLYRAYQTYTKDFNDQGALAALYENQRRDKNAITPTYLPAVLNNAYHLLNTKYQMSEEDSIQHASRFMCQFLRALLQLPHGKRYSAMKLAKETNLEPILNQWLLNPHDVSFVVNEQDNETLEARQMANQCQLRR